MASPRREELDECSLAFDEALEVLLGELHRSSVNNGGDGEKGEHAHLSGEEGTAVEGVQMWRWESTRF